MTGSIIGYNNNANNSISLKNNTALARVDGSFASVFPIIGTDVPTFYETFYGCTKLAGPSARNPDGEYLYNQFPSATTTQVKIMYRGATRLSDYDDIPTAWK